MEQIKLTVELESRSKSRLELGRETTLELVALMARAIVAVHLGGSGEARCTESRMKEGDNADNE